ncbi:MAG: hypothetical protein D3924_19660, partial [Candidatus Electrothrix sp. AR4]|nr:hypothetical protein [Candidatus Electrothrix sp. AR4]
MFLSQPDKTDTFGCQLLDEISLSEQTLNQLFAALLLTTFGVFIGSNLLLLEPLVLMRSSLIALPCFGLLLIFYMLSRQLGSLIWGITLTYGLMWLLVYSRQPWLVPGVYGLATVALLYTLRFLRVAHHRNLQPIFLMAVAAAAAAAILSIPGYTSFDMLSRLHVGAVHQDTLFHASIAAMIKNYGVVSTGLHGLVETPYHN